MKSLRLFPLALSVMMIGLCVFVGVTLAQAPSRQPLTPHLLPTDQIETPVPFDPAAPNHFQHDLLFASPQTVSDAPMPTPVMPTQLTDPIGSDIDAPQAFPWQPNQIVYDGTQLCNYSRDPSIEVDLAGNAYAVWQDCRNLNGNYNWDIYFAYRPADGSWGANVKVNDDPGYASQYRPAIAVDADGNAYAAWEDSRNGIRDIYFAYRPAGGSWGANVKVNDDPGSADQLLPTVAVDGIGNAYAAWVDSRNGNADIYFSHRPVGGSWGANVKVNDDPGTAAQSSPTVAVDGIGNAYAVWQDYCNGNSDIYFAYRPAGGSWGANVKVNDDPGSTGQDWPTISADAAGNAYAVWVDRRSGNDYYDIYFAYRPAGGSWGTNVKVNDDPGYADQFSPAIAVDAAGNAYAVWEDGRSSYGNPDIYFAHRPVGGSWGANVKVNDDPGSALQYSADIAVDGIGNTYAVWQDSRNGNPDIYFAYRPVGGVWDTNIKVNDDPGSADQSNPAIVIDGAGNAYAVWWDKRNDNGDVYFAYRSTGGSWGVNIKVNDDPGSASQSVPSIAVDAAGNAYAVWSDERNGNNDIYFAYRPAGGSWGANVKVNDDPGTAWQYGPTIAVDAAGNAYAVWTDQRSGNYDIYFAHRPVGGSWGAYVKVNDDPGSALQYSADIAVDGIGNTYAVWQDSRNGNGNPDIYFAYRPVGGVWSENGKVNDDPGSASQYNPDIAVDGIGNAYAVWQDSRNGNPDIYFAHRPVGGSWGANIKVNDDPGNAYQSVPTIAVDGTGNAYAAWLDQRGGNWAIYFAYRPVGGVWSENGKVNDDPGSASETNPAIAVDGAGNAYAVWQDQRHSPTNHIYFSYALHDDMPQRTPAPQITFPLPGATNQNSFSLQGLACPGCQVKIYDGNVLLSTVTATANGLFSSSVTLVNGSHTLKAVAQYTIGPTPWPPSLPSAPVPLNIDSSLRIDAQRLTLAYTMWGGQSVVLRPRDAAGLLVNCTGEANIPGFRIRPDLPNTLTVAVNGSPTQVQVIVSGVAVFDLAPIGGDVWETTFTVDATHDLTIRISDDGGATFVNQCTGQILIDPQGVVSDAGTGQPIQGATVTCYVATEGGEWARWPAENYDGQTNPQYTADNGFYAFFTPPGSYQIEAWAPGYVLQRTGTIIVTSQLVEVNLALQPVAAPCPADLNGDGEVSVTDIIAIAEKWNAVSPNFPYAPGFDLMPLGAPDGAITIADIQYVAAHWGETCTP